MGGWPLSGIEDLVKMEEADFKQGLTNLQKISAINSSGKLRKAAQAAPAAPAKPAPRKSGMELEGGVLTYRCAKSGGLNLPDRDEYVLEDQEVSYTEEEIGESAALQAAIAHEWLVQIEQPRGTGF